jgi:hypothetical protein
MKAIVALLVFFVLAPAFPAEDPPAPQPRLRLNLSPRSIVEQAQRNPQYASSGAPANSALLARIKLFESGDLSAALESSGKIHYRLPSPNILGTKLGGEVSTNSARVTLTWPPKN